jgi:SAM-dependent methyltransferase
MNRDIADADYWDRTYAQSLSSESKLWRRHSDAVTVALLRRWIPDSSAGRTLKTDLFDEALENGMFPALSRRSSLVVGIDLSLSVAAQAAEHHRGLNALTGDVRQLPFSDSSFDVVISNSTLDHFSSGEEMVGSIRELARVLRPGGKLIITLDNPANPLIRLRNSKLGCWLKKIGLAPYYLGYTCGIERLSEHLRRGGLEPAGSTAVMHCPRLLAVPIARLLENRDSKWQRRFLRCLMAFEFLERFVTRYRTGHFVAAHALKST